jgi:hypothetical protein
MAEVARAGPRIGRRRLLGLALVALTVPWRGGAAEEVATLRPGEAIELPGLTVTVLGLKVSGAQGDRTVRLQLRALSGPERSAMVDLDAFRLFAGGVPRAPVYGTTEERQMASFIVDRESAVDFTRVFTFPDRSDDLVLQIRVDGAVERRRLPASR